MKQNSEMLPCTNRRESAHGISWLGMVAAQAVLIGLGGTLTNGQEVDIAADDQGAQVLTRGPVHEAFAGIVSYNPEPGVIVGRAPPEAINELPPEIRPAGDNIGWIPGYWGWDDEGSDYLWISGTWRALPPGRQWTTGYWTTSGEGHQWISGYWADSSERETTYLPKPPVTVEVGPNVKAPSADYGWTPGSWMWRQERYAWRPGYWAEGRADWDWTPAQYVWTPRGYVFVDGFWDYSFERRGALYAPVHFQAGYYSRPGYSYSPVIAIGLVAVMEHLFLRPSHHHYYFGDYYDRRYRDGGYYSGYAYQSQRGGYDPVYSYRRWTHRQDRDWERRDQESFDYRRDHESARPPRTWADQKRLGRDNEETRKHQQLMAAPLDQMAKRKDGPMRIERVSEKERKKHAELGREVRKTSDQRRAVEKPGENAGGNAGRDIKPTKVKQPASPIAGKSRDRFPEKQAPPKSRSSPKAEPGKEAPERKQTPEKSRPDAKKEQPGPRPEAQPKNPKPKPQPEKRAEESRKKNPTPKAKEPERKTGQETNRPGKENPGKAKSQPQQQDPKKAKPASDRKSEPNKEDSEQSNGKAQKKEQK